MLNVMKTVSITLLIATALTASFTIAVAVSNSSSALNTINTRLEVLNATSNTYELDAYEACHNVELAKDLGITKSCAKVLWDLL